MAARIHILDDDPASFAGMARLLRERGHIVNTGAHDPQAPDLLLCQARHPAAFGLPGRGGGVLLALAAPGDAALRAALLEAGFDGYIALPVEAASFADEVEAFLPAATPAQVSPRAQTLLLVDDDPFMLEVLADMVEDQGWRVRMASSGAQALAMLRHEPVAVIVSDHFMPGMSGAELLAEAQRLYAPTVRILLSGQSEDEGEIAGALASGAADRYYAKPWMGATLMAALRDALALQLRRREGA